MFYFINKYFATVKLKMAGNSGKLFQKEATKKKFEICIYLKTKIKSKVLRNVKEKIKFTEQYIHIRYYS